MPNSKDEDTYEIISKWLEEYKITNSVLKKSKMKALIVTKMLPIIKRIARTIARRSYDPIEDMVQAGSIGLLKAIDSYSSKINDNFKIYAGYLIIGEMKHYLRDKLNTIKVPARIQELAYRINTFTSSLTYEELNNLTNDDVAEALNVPKKAVDMVLSERRKSAVSLEQVFNSDSNSLNYEELLSNDNYQEKIELEDMKIFIKDTIELLPDDCREVIKMFYYEDMSQREIADRLNLSKMQVYRRTKKAFSIFYKALAERGFVG